MDLQITAVVRAGSTTYTPITNIQSLHVGDRLIGGYKTDRQRGRARLHLQAKNAALRVEPSTTGQSSAPVAGQGPTKDPAECGPDIERVTWELDTSHMKPRAYTLTLRLVEPPESEAVRCEGSVAVDFRLEPSRLR